MLIALAFALAADPAPVAVPVAPEATLPEATLPDTSPSTISAPPVAPPSVPLLGQEPEYLPRALSRGQVTRKDRAPSGADWVVRTGTGRALGMAEFTRMVNDQLGERRLKQRRTAGVIEGVVLASIGTSMEIVALGMFAGGNVGSPDGEDWLWRGSTFAVAGAFPLVLCTQPARAIRERERWPALYYTTAQVDPLIEAFNQNLRKQLGLPSLQAITVTPTPTAPVIAPASEQDAPDKPPDRMPDAEPVPVEGGR